MLCSFGTATGSSMMSGGKVSLEKTRLSPRVPMWNLDWNRMGSRETAVGKSHSLAFPVVVDCFLVFVSGGRLLGKGVIKLPLRLFEELWMFSGMPPSFGFAADI